MLVLERMIVHIKIEFNRFAIYVVVLSFFSYIFTYIIWLFAYKLYTMNGWQWPVIQEPRLAIDALMDAKTAIVSTDVLWVTIVGIILSGILGYLINHKVINRLGQRLKITKKYGDETVWAYFHNKPGNTWVVVRDLKNDMMYFGWIEVFSDDGTEFDELVMREVTAYTNTTGDELYQANEVYLSGKREDLRIEIFNYSEGD